MRKVALFAVLAIFLMSCSETKRVTYLQKVESLPVEVLQQKSLLADPRIVPGDLLSISVGSVVRNPYRFLISYLLQVLPKMR